MLFPCSYMEESFGIAENIQNCTQWRLDELGLRRIGCCMVKQAEK